MTATRWLTVNAVALAGAVTLGCGGGASSKPDSGQDRPDGGVAASPWLTKDIGDVGTAKGSLEIDGATFTIRGGGLKVGGTADAFFFAYQKLTGDGEIVVRVMSLLQATIEATVGIMIRADDTDPAAPNVFLALRGETGTAGVLRSRATVGGTTTEAIDGAIIEGATLRLARANQIVSAYRDDGLGGWVRIGVVEIDLPAQIAMGIAVSAGVADSTAAAELDIVRVTTLAAGGGG